MKFSFFYDKEKDKNHYVLMKNKESQEIRLIHIPENDSYRIYRTIDEMLEYEEYVDTDMVLYILSLN